VQSEGHEERQSDDAGFLIKKKILVVALIGNPFKIGLAMCAVPKKGTVNKNCDIKHICSMHHARYKQTGRYIVVGIRESFKRQKSFVSLIRKSSLNEDVQQRRRNYLFPRVTFANDNGDL
jgi:hypothetical protein